MPSLKILNSANRNIVPVDKISYRISKILGAPRDYAYQWCTDFRDDDPKLIDASYTRHVVEKTKKRAIWIQHYSRDGVAKEGVRIVTFSPPDSWHLESVNEELDRSGDYVLRPAGREKTKLEIVIKTKYKSISPESPIKLKQDLSDDWDKYKIVLERDYSSSRVR